MRTKNNTGVCLERGKPVRAPEKLKSHKGRRSAGVLAALVLSLTTVACGPDTLDDPLAARGQELFARCAACHAADRAVTKVGPHLLGIFGRTAGTLDDFPYSEALVASGIVWDEANLAAFLHDPRDLVPGNRMAFVGLRQDADIAAIIAYLKAVSGPAD